MSSGSAGGVHAGDRLPWIPIVGGDGERPDNFEPLESLDWQAHVYGEPAPAVVDACRKHGLALHVFPWDPRIGGSGLSRDAVYLVRPDGYVGLAEPAPSASALDRYLDRWEIRPRQDLR